tara:strand:- start:135 stop:446 length:312 start_codon:yes stop_codon:yes gene_type:complete
VKTLLALLLPFTVYASEPTELNYKTAYLWQWVTACAQVMAPEFERQGMPRHFAMNWAVTGCSCVIDGFRKDYPFESIITLTSEERRAAGAFYANQCGKGEITL